MLPLQVLAAWPSVARKLLGEEASTVLTRASGLGPGRVVSMSRRSSEQLGAEVYQLGCMGTAAARTRSESGSAGGAALRAGGGLSRSTSLVPATFDGAFGGGPQDAVAVAGAFPESVDDQIAVDFPFLASSRRRSRGHALHKGMHKMVQSMQRGLKPLSTHWEQQGSSSGGTDMGLGLGSVGGEPVVGSPPGRQQGSPVQGLSLGMMRLDGLGSRPGSRQQQGQALLG